MCGRRRCEGRDDPHLDQTRQGTIVYSILGIHNKAIANRWQTVFSGHRTHLRVVVFEGVCSNAKIPDIRRSAHRNEVRLLGFTSFDLSYGPKVSS